MLNFYIRFRRVTRFQTAWLMLLLGVSFGTLTPTFGQQCVSVANGDWDDPATWSCTNGLTSPLDLSAANGNIVIKHIVAVPNGMSFTLTGQVIVDVMSGGTMDAGNNEGFYFTNPNSRINLYTGSSIISGGSANTFIKIGDPTSASTCTYGPFNGQGALSGPMTLVGGGNCSQTALVGSISLASASSTATVCAGGTASLSVTIPGITLPNTYTYSWAAPAGASVSPTPTNATSSTSNVVSATVTTPGMKTFTVTVTDASGRFGSTTIVVEGSLGNASLTGGVLGCTNSSVTLTATASGANGFTLSDAQTSPTGVFTVNTPGTYTVTIGTGAGCVSTATATVTQSNTPPAITFTSSVTVICVEGSATLTATGGTLYQFTGQNTPGASSTIGVGFSGVYSVTVTTAGNCTASASLTIAEGGGDEIDITLLASSSAVCVGTNVAVGSQNNALVPSQVSSLIYRWYKGGNLLPAQTTGTLSLPAVTLADAGEYTLEVDGGCGPVKIEDTFTLTVNDKPTVTVIFNNSTYQPNGLTPIILMPSVNNVPVQVLGGVFYEWKLVIDRINGYEIRQADSNATGIFTIRHIGQFYVTVYGANGCKSSEQGIIAIGGQ